MAPVLPVLQWVCKNSEIGVHAGGPEDPRWTPGSGLWLQAVEPSLIGSSEARELEQDRPRSPNMRKTDGQHKSSYIHTPTC